MVNAIRLDDPSILDAAEAAALLGADLELGLTSAQASRRLELDGPNALRSAPKRSVWRRLLSQFQDPLIYLLLSAIAITLVAWLIDGPHGWPVDAVVIAAVVALNGAIGFAQEARAAQAVAALARMSAVTSTVRRDGQVLRLPSVALVRGDLLLLGEGEAVGADARLIQAASLRVDEACLTGESQAVLKEATTLARPAALADRTNMVFKGTAVVQGTGLAVVTATGMATQVGSIAHLLEATAEVPSPLQVEVARIGRMLAGAVLIIAAVVVVTLWLASDTRTSADVIAIMLLGVSLAVAAVPEGLPAILSVVLALGVQRMARHQAIVKKMSSVETLGSTTVICTDKTGTLTRAQMTIERLVTASGQTRITGVGYAPQGQVEFEGMKLGAGPLHDEQVVLLSGGSLAGTAELRQGIGGDWQIHGDPTEAAFLVAERKLGVQARRARRFQRIGDIAFTSERKMMSTIARDHEHDDTLVVITKGAPDVLLQHCTRLRVGMQVLQLNDASRARILADVEMLSAAALRTLAVAYRPLAAGEDPQAAQTLEQDLIFAGTAGIIDPPREEAAQAVHAAQRAGIRVIMISGDHPGTAARIASDVGIVPAGSAALTGLQLDALDEAGLKAALRTTSVFARVAAAHKMRIVNALQADGHIVAMTGDGVNDAPALKSADIGIAMGVSGTEVTKQAARMILADDNFATLVQAVREGRSVLDNIRKFLRYLLSSNTGEVLTVFLGVVGAGVIGLHDPLSSVVLPLLATQLLWLNLITDTWPALAIGVDPPNDDVMARAPRPPTERVIDASMWAGVFEIGLLVAVVTLLTIDMYLPGGLIEGTQDLTTARTAGLTVLVFAHLFNAFIARSPTHSAFSQPFVNPWLWGAVLLSLLLQVAVVNLGVLNLAFGTAPLTLVQWGVCAAMGSVVLVYSELRKWTARRR